MATTFFLMKDYTLHLTRCNIGKMMKKARVGYHDDRSRAPDMKRLIFPLYNIQLIFLEIGSCHDFFCCILAPPLEVVRVIGSLVCVVYYKEPLDNTPLHFSVQKPFGRFDVELLMCSDTRQTRAFFSPFEKNFRRRHLVWMSIVLWGTLDFSEKRAKNPFDTWSYEMWTFGLKRTNV